MTSEGGKQKEFPIAGSSSDLQATAAQSFTPKQGAPVLVTFPLSGGDVLLPPNCNPGICFPPQILKTRGTLDTDLLYAPSQATSSLRVTFSEAPQLLSPNFKSDLGHSVISENCTLCATVNWRE